MSLFGNPRTGSEQPSEEPNSGPPFLAVDISKRYDIYCTIQGEDRLYEDVKVVAIRTFEPKSPIKGLVGGYLEVESTDGARMLLPGIRMYLICEHGVQPRYKVLRKRNIDEEG
jgi:hypothetical protein